MLVYGPDAGVLAHLHRQHSLLCDRAAQLEQTIKAVEEVMSADIILASIDK